MSTPEPAKGLQANAKVEIVNAIDLMTKALPSLGVQTEEGKAVLAALTGLSRAFGKSENKARELIPAQVMQNLASLPQAGGASQGQRQMAAQPPAGATQPPLPA
jgi:hypothetical protein